MLKSNPSLAGDVLTPNAVVAGLAELGRQLDAAVLTLRECELSAVRTRHAADLAESRAYLSAEGAVETRKHLARIATEHVEADALVAEATLRWLRARIRALDTRIEVGRSAGAALRAELKMLPYDPNA